jgi:hypothetical protein
MNLAGALAQLIAGERSDEPEGPPWLVEARDEVSGIVAVEAIADFVSAVARGAAYDLVELLTPVPIDEWIAAATPGIPSLPVDGYVSMQADLVEVGWRDPLLRQLLWRRHLEARRVDGAIAISPQDGDHAHLTLDLLAPAEAAGAVLLPRVSVVLDGELDWNGAAQALRAQTAQDGGEPDEPDCKEALVRGADGRLRSGCVEGMCRGICQLIGTGVVAGIQSYGCVCMLKPEIADEPDAQAAFGSIEVEPVEWSRSFS